MPCRRRVDESGLFGLCLVGNVSIVFLSASFGISLVGDMLMRVAHFGLRLVGDVSMVLLSTLLENKNLNLS